MNHNLIEKAEHSQPLVSLILTNIGIHVFTLEKLLLNKWVVLKWQARLCTCLDHQASFYLKMLFQRWFVSSWRLNDVTSDVNRFFAFVLKKNVFFFANNIPKKLVFLENEFFKKKLVYLENEFESDHNYEYWPPYCLWLSLLVMDVIGSARSDLSPPKSSWIACLLLQITRKVLPVVVSQCKEYEIKRSNHNR